MLRDEFKKIVKGKWNIKVIRTKLDMKNEENNKISKYNNQKNWD
jgi:hypothetical protein